VIKDSVVIKDFVEPVRHPVGEPAFTRHLRDEPFAPACHPDPVAKRRSSSGAAGPIAVYVEEGKRRTFAVAVDWPGWARAGRTPEAAVEALLAYLPRYADVVRDAGLRPPSGEPEADVVERVEGNATTEFGAPGVVAAVDRTSWTPTDAKRAAALLTACWNRLDTVAAAAPATLRKGPRGGGRDRDAIVEHVLGTEPAYARKTGIRVRGLDGRAAADEVRRQLLAAISDSPGSAAEDDARTGWPLPYVVRRVAWHALDHAWEIEDRTDA
jgi:hypothetical protein